MSNNVRNIIITAIISLFIGFMVGGISQTGCCPITGKVICKDRAAACEAKKACDAEKGSEKKEACCKDKPSVEETAPAVEAKH